ncbi:DgyrCDS14744 [Dimorphilus gyrociliatus]|uniref:Fascin n=1 Tax=Dimorphilus gyrociliatus TaxID=2664684 RepID=A0A7I8WF03_9ANNE|nr:DgyrCDS14744 [Dimorphilus gyrociliatus]
MEVGLINSTGRYLTAEFFGFRINATATTLGKKQCWFIEPGDNNVFYIRSHLGRYLSGDEKGNVSCTSESKGPNEQFIIEYCPENSGRWALRNQQTSRYFGGNEDLLKCYEKEPTSMEWWIPHLAIHPQINLQHVHRKTVACLKDNSLLCLKTIPWGSDSLITIDWEGKDGEAKYSLKSANNLYLEQNGDLKENSSQACLYRLEVICGLKGGLAFKDEAEKYLTAVGPYGKMQTRKGTIGMEESFIFQNSYPQGAMLAQNHRNVSIRQGVSLLANQQELEDNEIHQLEFEKESGGWSFRAANGKLWTVVNDGIDAIADKKSKHILFDLEYFSDGWMAVKARVSKKYLTLKDSSGKLSAASTHPEKFLFSMINRPIIVLRTEYGFIGYNQYDMSIKCDNNLSHTFFLEHRNGEYHIKEKQNTGNYCWTVTSNKKVMLHDGVAYPFYFEHSSQNKFVIRTQANVYIKCEQNGTVKAEANRQNATEIEF